MSIGEIIRQGFYYARTCRWLWLFGFFVGIASGGSSGAGGGDGDGMSVGAGGVAFSGGLPDLSLPALAAIAAVIIPVVAAVVIMRFVGEGALIEGIVRARRGGTMTTREGFRAGWAHSGVLVRITVLYLAATIGSIALIAAACVIALRALGPLLAAVLVGIPVLFIALPWLVTLYLVQAFAWRIAVLEDRDALDAIRKARLFLHGRLIPGLKLIVATLVGTLAILLIGLAGIVPVALVLVALIPVLHVFPVIVLACVVVVPPLCLLAAIVGTFRSSIWTIGYVTQVES